MQPSPYTPGEIAREVPGRRAQLADIEERLDTLATVQRLVGRVRVDVASRGMGKTSLLRAAEGLAHERGLVSLWVTAGTGRPLAVDLAEAVERSAGSAGSGRGRLGERLQALRVQVGVPGFVEAESTWAATPARQSQPGGASSLAGVRELEDVLVEAVQQARLNRRRGVVLFVDEVQSGDRHGLALLGTAMQHLQAEKPDLPFGIFCAGLPNAPEVIAAAVTFSERFAYRHLTSLDDDASALALVAPAIRLGVTWDPEALRAVVDYAQGYPYAVQLWGDAIWRAAGSPDADSVLTAHHVEQGREAVDEDLQSLFRARGHSASPQEQRMLIVMAELGGDHPVGRADIAHRMARSTDSLGPLRQRLLDKGLIESSGERGRVRFTIPGFGAYVLDRASIDSASTESI